MSYSYGFFRGLLQVFQTHFMQLCSHKENDSYACKCGYMTLLKQKIISNMITALPLGLTFFYVFRYVNTDYQTMCIVSTSVNIYLGVEFVSILWMYRLIANVALRHRIFLLYG